jgi:hypothetical protein
MLSVRRFSKLPDDGGDHIDEKARGGQSRQTSDVGRRIELDKVESCYPASPADARDQVDHLCVGEAASSTRRYAWMMPGSRPSQSRVTTTRARSGISRRAASTPSACASRAVTKRLP